MWSAFIDDFKDRTFFNPNPTRERGTVPRSRVGLGFASHLAVWALAPDLRWRVRG